MTSLNLKIGTFGMQPLAGKVAAGLSAALIGVGLAWCLVALTGVQLGFPAVAAGLAGLLATTAAACAFSGRGRAELVFLGAVAGALLVAALAGAGAFLGGAAQVANAWAVRVGEHTQIYAMPFVAAAEPELAFFCFVCGSALGLAAAVFVNRGGLAVVVIAGAAAVVLSFLGWLDAGWWAPALALGLLGAACVRLVQSDNVAHPSALAWACGALACVFAFICVCGVLAFRDGADVSAAQAAIDEAAYSLEYGDAAFAMPEGKLDGLGPYAPSDQVAMTVRVGAPTREYLRGFVGSRYGEGKWEPLGAEKVMQNRNLLYWLAGDGFENASQLADAAELVGFADVAPSTLEQSFETVRGPYAYLPYGYARGSSAATWTDMAQLSRAGGTQSSAFDAGVLRNAYLLQDAVDAAQEGETFVDVTPGAPVAQGGGMSGALRVYLDDDYAYSLLAADVYTEVPDEVSSLFRSYYGPSVKLTPEQAKIQVETLLDDSIVYSPEIETQNGDTDFVEYVLSESQSGYSVHYATVATLLMRYYGVPARYVEGYVLDTAKLDEAAAKDASESPAADDGAYTLTEEQAHAWVEYYLDGVGWLPFDVTPGWRDGSFYKTTGNTEVVEESQNWSIGEAADDAVWEPLPEEEPEEEPEETQPNERFAEATFAYISWPWVIAGFLLALLVAFAVRDALLHARLRSFLARGSASDAGADEVAGLFSYAVLLARECGGVTFANTPYVSQGPAMEAAGLCGAEVFESAARANDKALFAQAAPTEADVRAVRDCIEAMYAGLRATTSVPSRFWQRHVRCLW